MRKTLQYMRLRASNYKELKDTFLLFSAHRKSQVEQKPSGFELELGSGRESSFQMRPPGKIFASYDETRPPGKIFR